MATQTADHVSVVPGMLVEDKETGETFTVTLVLEHLGSNNVEVVDAKGRNYRKTASNLIMPHVPVAPPPAPVAKPASAKK